jgi:hypothetical protein
VALALLLEGSQALRPERRADLDRHRRGDGGGSACRSFHPRTEAAEWAGALEAGAYAAPAASRASWNRRHWQHWSRQLQSGLTAGIIAQWADDSQSKQGPWILEPSATGL